MAEHTPPPWGKRGRAIVGQGREIARVHTAFGIWDMNEANLNLMVAAPEMLETLEWVLDDNWNDGIGSWATVQRRLEAVIAKAKGEQHGE